MNLFKRSSGLIMVCDLARSCSPDLDVSIGRCYCATALASLTEIERRHLDAGPCAKRMRFSNVPNTPANQLRRLRQGKGVAHRINFYVISYVEEGTYFALVSFLTKQADTANDDASTGIPIFG